MAQDRDSLGFYHYLISSWIRAYPKKFVEIVSKHRDWMWAKGEPRFAQLEWRPTRKPKLLFYDLFLQIDAPIRGVSNRLNQYNVFIEIKTGKYNDEWITQLNEEYDYRPASWLRDGINLLLFIVRKSELPQLEAKAPKNHSGFLQFFELDYIEPYVIKDTKNLLEEIQNINVSYGTQ